MKKVTILSLHLNYGGVEKAITNLANMLVDKFEVEIVCVYQINKDPAFWLDDRVKIKYLLKNTSPNHAELKKALKERSIIKIIKEGMRAVKILYLRSKRMKEYIKRCNSDVIISSRVLFTNWLSKYGNKNSIKISQEHNHHNNNNKYIQKVVNSCKNIDYLMPVSSELTEFYEEQLKLKKINECRCVYIPHAIDNYSYQKSNLKNENLISIGRLSPEKGYLDLIEIFKIINTKNSKLKLHIVGDGPEREKIESKVMEYKLQESVILHGFRDKEYINGLLSQSSIYLMASYEESFGIVLLEAGIQGLPLIAFSTAQGAHEIIKNDYNGYLIENRDFHNFSETVLKLINDYDKRKELGDNSYKEAQKYSYDIIKEKNVSFFSGILKI